MKAAGLHAGNACCMSLACIDPQLAAQQHPPLDFFLDDSFLDDFFEDDFEDDFDDFLEDTFVGAVVSTIVVGTGATVAGGSIMLVAAAVVAGTVEGADSGTYILPPPLTIISGTFVQPPAAKVLAVSGAGAVPELGTYMPPPPLTSTCGANE
mmetsp:Transcript_63641/g.205058  ORF Transcript_63641/g.205058 Transcript_63641/m.205058 type:complete len:152 (-) Transcript_63641:184-639(-)